MEPIPREKVTHEAYEAAKEAFESASEDPEVAWRFGRTCFDWAEFSTNDTQRAELAHEGIVACEMGLEANSELAGVHYYLGMNQGQLARTMSLGALKLVRKMEAHFLKAQALDPTFEEAGPDRNLGLLYLQAPGWPVSLGNRSKARVHLGKAVTLAPDFPENRLNLMEAYARWNETNAVTREIEAWEKNLEKARKKFSGNQWLCDWRNWNQRLEALKQHLAKPAPELRTANGRG